MQIDFDLVGYDEQSVRFDASIPEEWQIELCQRLKLGVGFKIILDRITTVEDDLDSVAVDGDLLKFVMHAIGLSAWDESLEYFVEITAERIWTMHWDRTRHEWDKSF